MEKLSDDQTYPARYASDPQPLTGHVAEVLLYLGKHSDTDRISAPLESNRVNHPPEIQ